MKTIEITFSLDTDGVYRQRLTTTTLPDPYYDDAKNKCINDEKGMLYVATTPDDEIVGFTYFLLTEVVSCIHLVYVFPKYRRKGVGFRMVGDVSSVAKSHYSGIVWAQCFNDFSVGLHQKLGFKRLNEVDVPETLRKQIITITVQVFTCTGETAIPMVMKNEILDPVSRN